MQDNNLEWLEFEKIEEGLNDNRFELTSDLVRKDITLYMEGGVVIRYHFVDEGKLEWELLQGDMPGTKKGVEKYQAIHLDSNLYLVGFHLKEEPLVFVTLVIDLVRNTSLVCIGNMPTLENTKKDLISYMREGVDLSPVKVSFISAEIDTPTSNIRPYERTTDFIGKRVKYAYADDHQYEHIYLNDNFYTWHCIEGPEKGLAETEKCDYFRIRDDFYFFSWHEKTVPTLGMLAIDLKRLQSNGFLFGIDTQSGKPHSFSAGAKGVLLNNTSF